MEVNTKFLTYLAGKVGFFRFSDTIHSNKKQKLSLSYLCSNLVTTSRF